MVFVCQLHVCRDWHGQGIVNTCRRDFHDEDAIHCIIVVSIVLEQWLPVLWTNVKPVAGRAGACFGDLFGCVGGRLGCDIFAFAICGIRFGGCCYSCFTFLLFFGDGDGGYVALIVTSDPHGELKCAVDGLVDCIGWFVTLVLGYSLVDVPRGYTLVAAEEIEDAAQEEHG